MGEVCHTASWSFHGRKEFNKTKNDDEVPSGNREKKIDVNGTIGKQPAKREKDAVNGSGGANDRDGLVHIRSKKNGTDTRSDSAEQKVS